jgi:hypothetical protein
MLKKNFLHWVACVIAVAIWLSPKALFAQVGAAVLTGTVVDASNKQPVADVVVTVTSPALQGEQTVVTDTSGLYRVPDLPPGVYTLRLDKEKYKPYARETITLRSDTTIRVNAELLPEALKAEEVTVVARPPTVDVGSSSTGMNIGQDFTRRVPVSRPGGKGSGSRSFESVAEAVPGAKNDAYGVSISGTTSPENNYVLDGTSVNNPSYGTVGTPLSLEFIKELNVISGGYMPEYGRSTGGILNVVTKSGSNEFHGGVFGYYTPGALEGSRKLVTRDAQSVQTQQFLGYIGDIGADIGGPIQKDKLWFYFGVDFAKTRFGLGRSLSKLQGIETDPASPNFRQPLKDANDLALMDTIPGTYQSYVAEMTQIQAMGKLTYAVNTDNTLTLALFATPTTSGGDGKYAINPQTGNPEADPRTTQGLNGPISAIGSKRSYDSYDASLKWSSAFSNKRVLLDTTLGWHHQNTSILPNDGSEIAGSSGQAAINRIAYRRTASGARDYHSITDFQTDADLGLAPGTLAAACPSIPLTDAMGMPSGSRTLCPAPTYNLGGSGFIQRQVLDRYQGKSVLTTLFQGAGHHVVKVGIDLEYVTYDNIKAYSGPPGAGIFYRENTGGTRFDDYRGYGFLQGPDDPVLLNKVHTLTKSVTAGGFVQDSWSIVDKVTLNVGVRYDAQFLYNAAGDRGLSMPNEWSPRIGVIYDPTQSGRAKIYANYARFYESVPLDIADRSLSSEPGTQARHPANKPTPCATGGTPPNVTSPGAALPCTDPSLNLPNGINDPVDPNFKWATLGAGSTPVDPDIKPQSSDEIVLGGEYEVIKDGRLGANYTKRWMNYVIEDMSRDEATTYFLGNPGYGIASDFPKAERKYDAVTLYFEKIFADEWLGSASYTISRLYGNYAGLFRPETQQLDPNINSDFDLKSLLPNRTGPLPGDRTHQIKLFGAKDWGLDQMNHVTTGLGFRATSGEPNNTLGSHNIYGPDEVFILPRGSAGPNGVSDRLPWNFSADLQLGYQYRIDKDKTAAFTIDIFNLFNFQAETARDNRYTIANVFPVPDGKPGDIPAKQTSTCVDPTCKLHSADDNSLFDPAAKNANYGRPTQYQPPRVFRFGLRMTF